MKNVKKLKYIFRNLKARKYTLCGIKYHFGVRFTRNIAEAYKLNELNGNMLWSDAIERDVKLLRDDFECFCIGEESEITNDYQKIPLPWTFAVKIYGRHRARLCAGEKKQKKTTI